MDFGRKIITYYSREFRIWVAFFQDANGDQIGVCRYGNTKKDAIEELKFYEE